MDAVRNRPSEEETKLNAAKSYFTKAIKVSKHLYSTRLKSQFSSDLDYGTF